MDFKYLFPPFQIRPVHYDMPVEPARSEQRLVQDLRTIGCGKDNDPFLGVKPIHFREQLCQGLFMLFSAGNTATASGLAHSVYLINKDNAGCLLLCPVKELSYSGSTDSGKHLDKGRASYTEKRHISLSGNRLGQKSLT